MWKIGCDESYDLGAMALTSKGKIDARGYIKNYIYTSQNILDSERANDMCFFSIYQQHFGY